MCVDGATTDSVDFAIFCPFCRCMLCLFLEVLFRVFVSSVCCLAVFFALTVGPLAWPSRADEICLAAQHALPQGLFDVKLVLKL